MRAIRVNGWGQPLQLENIGIPVPEEDEVLVRVHAASINPFDAFVYAGYLQQLFSVPLTLGTDFAGEVVEAGSQVTHVKPGDAVFGLVPMHPGSFAEYCVAKVEEVALKPQTLSFIEAGAVPLAALAAYQSLIVQGQPSSGERVLIIGAAGTVGSYAIQLAKTLGVEVLALARPARRDFVRQLGADQFIDAEGEAFEKSVGKVDLVLDYLGGDYILRAYNVLKPGGRFISSTVFQPPQEEAEKLGITCMGLGTSPNADQLADIAQRIDAGALKVFINCTFPLEETQQALEYRQTKTEPGKVVLTIL